MTSSSHFPIVDKFDRHQHQYLSAFSPLSQHLPIHDHILLYKGAWPQGLLDLLPSFIIRVLPLTFIPIPLIHLDMILILVAIVAKVIPVFSRENSLIPSQISITDEPEITTSFAESSPSILLLIATIQSLEKTMAIGFQQVAHSFQNIVFVRISLQVSSDALPAEVTNNNRKETMIMTRQDHDGMIVGV